MPTSGLKCYPCDQTVGCGEILGLWAESRGVTANLAYTKTRVLFWLLPSRWSGRELSLAVYFTISTFALHDPGCSPSQAYLAHQVAAAT